MVAGWWGHRWKLGLEKRGGPPVSSLQLLGGQCALDLLEKALDSSPGSIVPPARCGAL